MRMEDGHAYPMDAPSQPILDAVLIAYRDALVGKLVMFEGKRYEPHDIDKLSNEVDKWRRMVDMEKRSMIGNVGPRSSTAVFRDA